MIERGGYGFEKRVAALLGAAASPQTIALVQHTLRATNPTGFMQPARFLTGGETPPLGARQPDDRAKSCWLACRARR